MSAYGSGPLSTHVFRESVSLLPLPLQHVHTVIGEQGTCLFTCTPESVSEIPVSINMVSLSMTTLVALDGRHIFRDVSNLLIISCHGWLPYLKGCIKFADQHAN